MASQASVRSVFGNGRYSLHREFAVGGMASLYLARQKGAGGFQRVVAVKRLHSHLAEDPDFVAMFLDEVRMVARIRHPNVVPVIDVVSDREELLLVMEYVHGETLTRLMNAEREANRNVPGSIAASIMIGALQGLHAAHEATDETGRPLNIVHRDVSPHNLLVGVDGVVRVIDFGIARSSGRLQHTQSGLIKGKVAYMAPEQLDSAPVSRRTDVFAAGVILWELITGKRMIEGPSPVHQAIRVLNSDPIAPGDVVQGIPPRLDAVVLRALQRDPAKRFASAREMATALEFAILPASARAVGDYVADMARDALSRRARMVREAEAAAGGPARLLSMVSIPDDDVFEDVDLHAIPVEPESIVPAANTVAPPRSVVFRSPGSPARSLRSAFAVLLISAGVMSPAFVHGGRIGSPSAVSESAASSSLSPASLVASIAETANLSAPTSASASAPTSASASAPALIQSAASAQVTAAPVRRVRKRPAATVTEPPPEWPPPE